MKSVHEGIKDNKCDICGKAFSSKKNIYAHIDIVHKKLQKHKCNKCEKTFKTNHYLKHHTSKVH